ncbi:response regulator [Kineothrix sp. MSJ-39]|uniref:response regulator n=1 Tax=Kineothrix sp. MSJ-39 TaxID=2841533 RepID=UPI001C0F96B3|nr:response regulator [Kineothrix sp. MSJ-39]MBU5429453.1 response regulator [Kineothrix sp. MSJ-39]
MGKLQTGCFIITIFIMILYFSVKRTVTRSHKLYSLLLIISLLYLVFDRITVYTVNHISKVPAAWNQLMHRLFLMSLVACIYLIYRYVLLMIYEEAVGENGWLMIASVAAAGVLPLYYRITELGNYSYGPAAYVTYGSVAIYTVMMSYSLLCHYKDMEKKKREIILITVVFQVTISVYQAFRPLSLISCLGITLVNLGFFLTVESPDIHLIEQLKEEKKLAEGANHAKSAFLANMSHEIRTPIHAVIGMSEMILRESREKEILSYAGDIYAAANSLLGIVNDILDFSKIESGHMEIEPVTYQLSSLLHDIYMLIGDRARQKGLSIQIKVNESIPSVLYGDDVRLKQILVNLMTNAVKYTEQGTVTLNVDGGIKGNTCALDFQVKDTGIGIKEEDINKLFEAFTRIEEKRNRTIEGTGLGINITQQLLLLMGSTLRVESVYGKGSCFFFTVEQKIVSGEAIGNLEERLKNDKGQKTHHAGFRAPNVCVLVTDDIDLNRRVFKGLLKQTGIQVVEAESGRECIRKAKEEVYDLIFMDNMMPDMDGIEAMHRLRLDENGKNRKTPVIMLTANAIAGAREEYEREGFDGYLSKPIDPQKLKKEICRFISSNRIEEVGEKEENTCFDRLTDLSCFQWDYAKLYNPEEEQLLELLNGLRQTLPDFKCEWRVILEKKDTEIDLDELRIAVHSLKGLTAAAGALTISSLSKVIETAARDGNIDRIKMLLPVLLEEIERGENDLAMLFQETKQIKSEDMQQLQIMVQMILDAMCRFDYDEADRIEKKLEQYQYVKPVQDLVLQLQESVRDLNNKKAVELGERIRQMMRGEII